MKNSVLFLMAVLIGILFYQVNFDRLGSGGETADYVMTTEGVLFDASTTLLAVKNPFNATTTLDYFEFNQTGVATSTFTLTVGTSTTASGDPTDFIIDEVVVNTSTKRMIINGGNLVSSAGSNSKDRIIILPDEYIVAKATTTGLTAVGAFTNASNTFEGTYKLGWIQ